MMLSSRTWIPHVLAAAVTAALALPAMAQTPTLGELAKKEQERRKALPSAGKVVTNKDLPKSTAQPVPAPAAGVPAAAKKADEAKKPDQPKDEETKDEAFWRARMAQAREQLRRAEMFRDALQSRINALSADFVNRDDPYQRAVIGEDRQKAMAEMERVKGDIEKATKGIADIEEEARQAGVPPGWVR
jgi:hypothetical protein